MAPFNLSAVYVYVALFIVAAYGFGVCIATGVDYHEINPLVSYALFVVGVPFCLIVAGSAFIRAGTLVAFVVTRSNLQFFAVSLQREIDEQNNDHVNNRRA